MRYFFSFFIIVGLFSCSEAKPSAINEITSSVEDKQLDDYPIITTDSKNDGVLNTDITVQEGDSLVENEENTTSKDKVIEENILTVHNPNEHEIKEKITEETEQSEESKVEFKKEDFPDTSKNGNNITEDKEEQELNKNKVEAEKESKIAIFSHDLFESLVSKYIDSNGNVNYTGFKTDEGKLDSYLNSLSQAKIDSWSNKKKLAYWINFYNAATIKVILSNFPLNKITDLDGGKVWDRVWIDYNGKKLSLNEIEHEIIRKQFNEPRIHFAVNCAAKSCPPIWNHAWTESNLERGLDTATKKFINNTQYNQISSTNVKLSQIFNWYGVDFGDLINYINKYSNVKVSSDASVGFIEYDWALNGK